MALVDLKLNRQEQKEETAEVQPYAPDYPYGFCLHIDGDELDKLGVDLPEVGDEFHIVARGKVTRVSSSASESSDNRSVEIQITAAEMQNEGQDPKDSYAEDRAEAAESGAVMPRTMMHSTYRRN